MQLRLITLTAAAATLVACSDASSPLSPDPTRLTAAQPGASGIWAEQIVDNTGPGSVYGIFVPNNWNGNAVFYAHGVRDVFEDVDLPSNAEPLRDALGMLGYAFAYSSWSSNGYAVADAVRRQHQLRGLFVSKFGQPERSYLVSHSLGSLVNLALAERYPGQYDGALFMCGLLGGAEFEFNYIGNVRLIFDFFYPGVLPGSVNSIPLNVLGNPNLIRDPALQAIGADPTGAGIMFQIDQIPLAGNDLTEKITTLVSVLVAHSRFVNDVLGRVHNRFPFSNDETTYTTQSADQLVIGAVAFLDANIERFAATPDVRSWLDHTYEPTGHIRFPVLTLHTDRDYFVPVQHEDEFFDKVNNAGAADLLVQRVVSAYGHCALSGLDMITAFQDLVDWVENDNKP
jgi:pimeloyl-ACP methyl ester carboxylesterase